MGAIPLVGLAFLQIGQNVIDVYMVTSHILGPCPPKTRVCSHDKTGRAPLSSTLHVITPSSWFELVIMGVFTPQ